MSSPKFQSTTASYGQWRQRREVHPIDCPFPPTYHRTVPPDPHLLGANARHKSQDLLQPVGCERTTFGMPGHGTARAAIQWGV